METREPYNLEVRPAPAWVLDKLAYTLGDKIVPRFVDAVKMVEVNGEMVEHTYKSISNADGLIYHRHFRTICLDDLAYLALLPVGAINCLLALISWAGKANKASVPISTLSEILGTSPTSVCKAIKKLEVITHKGTPLIKVLRPTKEQRDNHVCSTYFISRHIALTGLYRQWKQKGQRYTRFGFVNSAVLQRMKVLPLCKRTDYMKTLLYIASRTNDAGVMGSFQPFAELASLMGKSRQHVYNHIKAMETIGLVAYDTYEDGGHVVTPTQEILRCVMPWGGQ